MENRGLCTTCIYDKGCIFPRRFPVWQCETFSDSNSRLKGKKKQATGKRVRN